MALPAKVLSRRDFTLMVGGATVVLAACDGEALDTAATDKAGTDTGDSAGDSGNTDSADTADTSDTGETGDPAETGETGSTSEWATGGTAAMEGGYTDPFTAATDCAMYCKMTLGPCYDTTPERQDVSEGVDGLPLRLALRILNEDCTPIEGALVEIWHTAPIGLYSGSNANPMCTDGNAQAQAALWFRGGQYSTLDGRVDFDTCFPGWYTGRAIHIHFRVVRGTDEYSVSQLFFPQSLVDSIVASEPIYSDRGPVDTTNSTDGVLGGADEPALYEVEWAIQADGAMLAWKTIVIRNAMADDQCDA